MFKKLIKHIKHQSNSTTLKYLFEYFRKIFERKNNNREKHEKTIFEAFENLIKR